MSHSDVTADRLYELLQPPISEAACHDGRELIISLTPPSPSFGESADMNTHHHVYRLLVSRISLQRILERALMKDFPTQMLYWELLKEISMMPEIARLFLNSSTFWNLLTQTLQQSYYSELNQLWLWNREAPSAITRDDMIKKCCFQLIYYVGLAFKPRDVERIISSKIMEHMIQYIDSRFESGIYIEIIEELCMYFYNTVGRLLSGSKLEQRVFDYLISIGAQDYTTGNVEKVLEKSIDIKAWAKRANEVKKTCCQRPAKTCAECAAVEKKRELMVCVRCRCTYYCSRKCQKIHWKKQHKEVCLALELI